MLADTRPRILYPTDEARHQIGVGRSTLYRLWRQGLIRPVKIGSRSLWPRDDLLALCDRLRAEVGHNGVAPIEAIGGRTVPTETKCAAVGSTSTAALVEGTADALSP